MVFIRIKNIFFMFHFNVQNWLFLLIISNELIRIWKHFSKSLLMNLNTIQKKKKIDQIHSCYIIVGWVEVMSSLSTVVQSSERKSNVLGFTSKVSNVKNPVCHWLYLKFLKVSWFWKNFLKFSFAPKNKRKYFCISALASK